MNRFILMLACINVGLLCSFGQTNKFLIVVPNIHLIGESLGLTSIGAYMNSTNGTKPTQIAFDLKDGTVIGISAEYPPSVSFTNMEEVLSELLTEESKRQISDNTVIWRNEKRGYSIALGKPNKGENLKILIRKFASMK